MKLVICPLYSILCLRFNHRRLDRVLYTDIPQVITINCLFVCYAYLL